jgi:hypothetical protein
MHESSALLGIAVFMLTRSRVGVQSGEVSSLKKILDLNILLAIIVAAILSLLRSWVLARKRAEPANNKGFYYCDSNITVRTMCHGRNTGGGNPWVWSGESCGWIMKPSLPTFVILPV